MDWRAPAEGEKVVSHRNGKRLRKGAPPRMAARGSGRTRTGRTRLLPRMTHRQAMHREPGAARCVACRPVVDGEAERGHG